MATRFVKALLTLDAVGEVKTKLIKAPYSRAKSTPGKAACCC